MQRPPAPNPKTAAPTKQVNNVPGFKDYLESEGIDLRNLRFTGTVGTCYYCGSTAHKPFRCDAVFGSSSMDTDREKARDLGAKYFAK